MNTMLHATTGRDATELRNGTGALRGHRHVSFGALLLLTAMMSLSAQLLVAQANPNLTLVADRQRETRLTVAETANALPATVATPDQGPALLNADEVAVRIGYPSQAQVLEAQGRVIVRVLVDAKGMPVHWIIPSANVAEPLRDAVVAQVPALRFRPAVLEGQAVACWVTLPVRFVLQ